MSLESYSGIGAGITTMLLGILGINKNLNKKLDKKQDKTTCDPIHKGIEDKFETIIKRQDKTLDRLDVIYDHLINGKRVNRPD